MGRAIFGPVSERSLGLFVADEVRALCARRQPRVTQQDIATALGRSQNYASERIRGEKYWTIEDLDVIAGRLGITAEEIVRNADLARRREPDPASTRRGGRYR